MTKTSEELWEEAELAFSRAIDAVVPEAEKRIDVGILLDLALKSHAGALAEHKKSIAAITMAVRRAQRALRFARRAEITLVRAARLHARANETPFSDVIREALDARS